MRAMNGRLQSVLRSPLMRNNQLNHVENGNKQHHHHHRRRESEGLPGIIQFDESADEYRCFCSCFHIKTGAYVIAVFNMIRSVNVLLILLLLAVAVSAAPQWGWGQSYPYYGGNYYGNYGGYNRGYGGHHHHSHSHSHEHWG
uniref:Neuropeptide-like protein 31 n=1 Tax=Bursaphelenchus xylophilus TaxID=6326 RepID=A0A1I7RIP7_BURXY